MGRVCAKSVIHGLYYLLLKQRKTQSQTPPEIAIEPKQLGLVCKEVNSLLASSQTTSVPILGNYECKMSEVLP